MPFQLQSDYQLAGDQPQAVSSLIGNYRNGDNIQTLHGATGTGKTFTMANIIKELGKPTLILSHNKTLAAQLATEFKHFFPKNAVHYFISYFDYYQPESYLPTQDLYIEKESTVNMDIQMYRLSTLASLLTRKDVIVVASVSALYGLGKKEFFKELSLTLEVGKEYDFKEIKKQLIKMQYNPVNSKIEQGMFEFNGEILDIYSSIEKVVYRCHFDEEKLEYIETKDALTYSSLGTTRHVTLRPATQFLQNTKEIELILQDILKELDLRVKEFEQQGKAIEAQRLKKRVEYDVRMIRETGFTNGIENYSPYFDGRNYGEAPNTLFDYFGDDMLLIVDESHMSIPQLQAMPKADSSRKINLINHGFRLPSAIDHRPLRFDEFTSKVGRTSSLQSPSSQDKGTITEKISQADQFRGHNDSNSSTSPSNSSNNIKTLFVSATPAPYEQQLSQHTVEQIIRPTGLLDPLTYVYPKSGNYEELIKSIDILKKKKPEVKKYLA